MNQDQRLAELEREAQAKLGDRHLQRRLDRELLRAGQRDKVEQRLSQRLQCPARWCRLKGGGMSKERRLRPRLCTCCDGPAFRCEDPTVLKEWVNTGACIACPQSQRKAMIGAMIEQIPQDDYQEPHCLMSYKLFGQLTVTESEGQTSRGKTYKILDLEGRFDGSETGPNGPFFEEFEKVAADYDYVIVTMGRIYYFDEMAFSIFMGAQSILQKKGGDLLLSSLKSGNIAALQMIVGNVFETATNIFKNEEDALAALESRSL